MTGAPMHEVKSAADVLSDDVICQSFVQSSSTLAYACLLIRRKQYDLAVHVLHSLEAKQASRFRDMVFYLQAQIGIETGDFAMVKKRLVPRVNQHPNDMVALSLLECCIHLEVAEWEKQHPHPQAAPAAPASFEATGPMARSAFSGSTPGEAAPGPKQARPASAAPVSGPMPERGTPAAPPVEVPPPRNNFTAPPAGSAQESDFGLYQALVNDGDTQALALWNSERSRFKSACRNMDLEPLMALLPHLVPGSVQAACASLESGPVHKICFSFQNLTVTSLHAGAEHLGIVTGHINHSLLTIVRAENSFRKQAASAVQAAAPRPRGTEFP